jgi:hypothetical protein
LIKNHQKCIEIMSLAVSLAVYELSEPLALAYFFTKNLDKELAAILDSVRKEYELKNDEPMMRNFLSIV